jgi:putative flippase GtrA
MREHPEVSAPSESLARRFPLGQVIRYLIVGAWNTLFGYGLFALFTYLLRHVASDYAAAMTANVLSSVIAITVAFLGYKWFVFKTKGNYLREYLRCYVVYGTAFLIGLALLPVLMMLLNAMLVPRDSVPYIAGAILTAGTVLVSFVGHRQFSFATKNNTESP